jgi:hypothetical protein
VRVPRDSDVDPKVIYLNDFGFEGFRRALDHAVQINCR